MHVISTRKLVDDARHNAFTDLVRFGEHIYLAFRSCPDGHMIYASSEIVIMRSPDGVTWDEVTRYSAPGRDLRDPHFLQLGGRLFAYSGAWPVTPGNPNAKDFDQMAGYVAYSEDGTHWSAPRLAGGTKGSYVWRAAAHDGIGYLSAKRYTPTGTTDVPTKDIKGHKALLLTSRDGLSWTDAATIVPEGGDETALWFEPDGRLVALSRNRVAGEGALLCTAEPPYQEWTRTRLSTNIGGPLLINVQGEYVVAGRRQRPDQKPVTALYRFKQGDLEEFCVLPSGGDNSYPGYVPLGPDKGLFSYYSSHEGGTQHGKPPSAIYLAEVWWD